MSSDLWTPERIEKARQEKLLDDEALSLLESRMPQLPAGKSLSDVALSAPPPEHPATALGGEPPPATAPSAIDAFKNDISQGVGRLSSAFGGRSVALASDAPQTSTTDSSNVITEMDKRLAMPSADEVFDQGRYASAIGQVEEGHRLQAAAAERYAEGEGAILRAQADAQEEFAKDQKLKEIARQKRMEAKQAELDEAIGQFEDADIDPSRLYTNASTAGKVMGAISLALGAFGASANGGENKAATIIRDAINRDVDIQKAEISKLGDMVSAKRNLLQDMRLKFSDEREAEAATKLAMLNQAELQIKALASQYKGETARAEATKAIGALQLEKEKLRSEYMQNAALAQLKGGKLAGLPEKLREVYVDGYGLAQTKEEAIDLRTAMGEAIAATNSIDELLGMVGKGGSMSPAERAKAKVIIKQLQGQIRTTIVGPGTVTDADQKVLDSIVANPTALFSFDSTTTAALQALKNKTKANVDAKAAGMGLTPEGNIRTREAK